MKQSSRAGLLFSPSDMMKNPIIDPTTVPRRMRDDHWLRYQLRNLCVPMLCSPRACRLLFSESSLALEWDWLISVSSRIDIKRTEITVKQLKRWRKNAQNVQIPVKDKVIEFLRARGSDNRNDWIEYQKRREDRRQWGQILQSNLTISEGWHGNIWGSDENITESGGLK